MEFNINDYFIERSNELSNSNELDLSAYLAINFKVVFNILSLGKIVGYKVLQEALLKAGYGEVSIRYLHNAIYRLRHKMATHPVTQPNKAVVVSKPSPVKEKPVSQHEENPNTFEKVENLSVEVVSKPMSPKITSNPFAGMEFEDASVKFWDFYHKEYKAIISLNGVSWKDNENDIHFYVICYYFNVLFKEIQRTRNTDREFYVAKAEKIFSIINRITQSYGYFSRKEDRHPFHSLVPSDIRTVY